MEFLSDPQYDKKNYFLMSWQQLNVLFKPSSWQMAQTTHRTMS